MPIAGKGEEKVKGLRTKIEEFVLKENAAVQTDRLTMHICCLYILDPVMFQLLFTLYPVRCGPDSDLPGRC